MSTAAPVRAPAHRRSDPPLLRYFAIGGGVLLVVLLGALWYLSAYWTSDLPTVYGKRRGPKAGESVSGTSVLSNLFENAGHRARSLTRLSPRLDDFQVIVWAPNDFDPPTAEQREWLETWLADGSGRTLVYIGRDYDATSRYWQDVKAGAPPKQAEEIQRRLATALSENETERAQMPEDEFAGWFTVQRDGTQRRVKTLSGPWAEGVDPAKVDIELQGRLLPPTEGNVPSGASEAPPDQVEVLLESEGDALVTRLTDDRYGDGQILVLTNGSFVLNYPLVNHENRKLAAKLVNECGDSGGVAFVESGPGGPDVLDEEPENKIPSGLGLIKVWPLNVILLHLTMLGIVYCFARWPIFGRPKNLPPESSSDFGKHVTALGGLMQKSKDTAYAEARLQQYREHGKRESGRSHARN